MDLYLLNELNKLEAGGAGSSGASSGSMFLPPDLDGTTPNDVGSWPIITRASDRAQTDNWGWTSTSPYEAFYTYGGNNDKDAEHGVLDCLHAGYTENNKLDNWTTGTEPALAYSLDGAHVGTQTHYSTKWSGADYGPFRTSIMWLRNMSGSTINSAQVWGRYSSHYQSGHDGASIWIGKPNSAAKGSVTSMNWTRDSYTGSAQEWNGSVSMSSVTNGQTICVLGMNTMYYHQDSANVASWQDTNIFYNLQTLWNQGFRPDYNMYKTSLLARDGEWNSFQNSNRVKHLYTMCAYEYPET
jgi:hypothetical protein